MALILLARPIASLVSSLIFAEDCDCGDGLVADQEWTAPEAVVATDVHVPSHQAIFIVPLSATSPEIEIDFFVPLAAPIVNV